jgi:hypothetical protein
MRSAATDQHILDTHAGSGVRPNQKSERSLQDESRAERLAVRKIVHLILDEAQTISDD